jgi:AcrR family transcriptional regulator
MPKPTSRMLTTCQVKRTMPSVIEGGPTLYHQFKDKEELALAVLEWVNQTWWREVGGPAEQEPDPVAALLALARGHAVYCRRDVARVMMALRVEFSGQDHPVGREIRRVSQTLMKRCARLIDAGRRDGSIPPGPPAKAVALAFWGALEGPVIALAGQAPHDELLAPRAVAGVLGLDSPTVPQSPEIAPTASAARRPTGRQPPHAPGLSD